jgi:hypothetical protein
MKKALLIGCNYNNSPSQLYGCIDDVINMRNVLVDVYAYDPANIILLRDDYPNNKPTRANITSALNAIIKDSANCEEIWIHYSGHGSQVKDTNGDEASGNDSVIVPLDYLTAGFIVDDDLYTIISKSKCRTILLFDSCNSGTVVDLPWSINYSSQTTYSRTQNNKYVFSNPNIFMMSGCRDNQTSADTYSLDWSEPCGAFTFMFINSLRAMKHEGSFMQLYRNICYNLMQNGFSQIPVLSGSSSTPDFTLVRAGSRIVNAASATNNSSASVPNGGTVVTKKNISMIFA